MTLDVFTWEAKHTKAVIICIVAIAAVILFHKEERKWIAGGLGVAAAVLSFT